jgi:hypothetical protein
MYSDVKLLHNNTAKLRLYINHTDTICQTSTIGNWIACAHFGKDVKEMLTRLLKVREGSKEIT